MRDAATPSAMGKLDGRTVAIIATDGFEEAELTSPKAELEREGARTQVLSLHEGTIRGWRKGAWAGEVKVDHLVADVVSDDFDGLLLPGGVMNPDRLRQDEDVVRLVQEFFDAGKTVAAICHGPQVLIETGEVEGRRMTSYPSLKTDLINAGADWVDEEVVEDENLVTSRSPDDLPAFNAKIVEAFRAPQPPIERPAASLEHLVEGGAPMPASFSPPHRRVSAHPSSPKAPHRPTQGRAMARVSKKRSSRSTRRPR